MTEVKPKITVGDPIGSGANGDCFRAIVEEGNVSKNAVIKYCTSEDTYDLARFDKEAEHLKKLVDSDNVIDHVYGAKVDEQGRHFYLLEEADRNLENLLEDEDVNLTFEEALVLLIGVCKGAEHAHSKKIVHRDLHPGNVLIVGDSNVAKLCDFGKARSFEEDWEYVSNQDWHLPPHLFTCPPERFFLLKLPDAFQRYTKTDIYSIGMLANKIFQAQTPNLTYFLPLQADVNRFLTKHKVAQTSGALPCISPSTSYAKRRELYELWLKEMQINVRTILAVDVKGASAIQLRAVNDIIWKCVHPDHDKRYNNISEIILELENVSST